MSTVVNSALEVYNNGVSKVRFPFGYDISSMEFKSQIRTHQGDTGNPIGEWVIENETDGADGVAIFTITLDNVTQESGWMDVVSVEGGVHRPLCKPFPVRFIDVVTLGDPE